ncbi:MAG: DUF1614 domain-containing protein [Crenarchaeota archaeon]|nr:DUF1614 domain-containing protein [Thermoproteota archaeon]
MGKLETILPWVSLSASLTVLAYTINPPSLPLITAAIICSTVLVALRVSSSIPIAVAVTSSFAVDIGGFIAPLLALSALAATSPSYSDLLISTAIYSFIAATIAKPTGRSVSINILAYSIPTTLALLTLLGASAAPCIPLASFLGVFLYADVAYYLTVYRRSGRSFIAGGAGCLDALVISPAISCCTALAFISITALF